MGPSQICGCPFREPRVFTIAHMDMGMPWVHGAVRVGHIETRLTSITLLFLLVFCWFPWTNCRITWSILSSAPHYPGHCGRGKRSNRSRTSDGDGVLSDLKISRSTGNEKDWSCGSTSICRIGRDMSKTFKDAVSTFDVFHANGSIY